MCPLHSAPFHSFFACDMQRDWHDVRKKELDRRARAKHIFLEFAKADWDQVLTTLRGLPEGTVNPFQHVASQYVTQWNLIPAEETEEVLHKPITML